MSLARIALALALLGACGAQIADGVSNSGSTGDDSALDAGEGSGSQTPIDATPVATCNQKMLFLNFEGQTLTHALTSDATKNLASWMQNNVGETATAPAYHKNDGGRATQIQTIVDGVKAQLATFPISVVTTRPATGNYVMIVLGGTRNDVTSRYGAAVNALDCGDLVKNDVAWIADDTGSLQHVMNLIVGATGFGLGLTATNDQNDCMCGWANNCQSNDAAPCKLGAPINRDDGADQTCQGVGATQDEVVTFHDAFCGKSPGA